MRCLKKLIDISLVNLLFIWFHNLHSPQIECNKSIVSIQKGLFVDKHSVVIDNQEIGFISCFKLTPFAILYDFFIYKEFRNKGYGSVLLNTAISQLKQNSYKIVFIQPGPFEIQNDQVIKITDTKKLENLVSFYSNSGFSKVNYMISIFTKFFYKLSNIDEDAYLLMFMKLK